MQHLREKTQFPGFRFSPGSAEALVRCGGKIVHFNCLLYRQHLCQKLSQSNCVCKIIASCKGGAFFLRHSVLVLNIFVHVHIIASCKADSWKIIIVCCVYTLPIHVTLLPVTGICSSVCWYNGMDWNVCINVCCMLCLYVYKSTLFYWYYYSARS